MERRLRWDALTIALVFLPLLLPPLSAAAQGVCAWDSSKNKWAATGTDSWCRVPGSSPEPTSPATRARSREEARRAAAEGRQVDARNGVRRILRQASDLYDRRQLGEALSKLQEAETRAEGSLDFEFEANAKFIREIRADLYRLRAWEAAVAGNFERASWWLQAAREMDPNSSQQTEEWAGWLASRRTAAERATRAAEAAAGMAVAERRFSAIERYNSADWAAFEPLARAVLNEDPTDAGVRKLLSQQLVRQERWAEAQSELLTLHRVYPQDTTVLNDLGLTSYELRDEDAAEAIFSEVVAIDPAHPEARKNLEQLRGSYLHREADWADAVRKAAQERAAWRARVKAKLEKLEPPDEDVAPRGFNELKAGDVLLLAPEDTQSHIIAITEQLYTGRVFSQPHVEAPASHAITFLGRDARGRALFLDNTAARGPHIIGQTEFAQEYASRSTWVARPEPVVEGRAMLEAGLHAVRDQDARGGAGLAGSSYGVLGKDQAVCSEAAAFAVARAVGAPWGIDSRWRLGFVDVTPGDFFDERHIGKYFIVTKMRK